MVMISAFLLLYTQKVIYTIADIAPKVIYGVMLTVAASMLSERAGFQTA